MIDIIVTLVNNRVPQGDAVDDNELPMRNTFPFFAAAAHAVPAGRGRPDAELMRRIR